MNPIESAALLALIAMYPDDAITCMEDAGSTDAETDLKALVNDLNTTATPDGEDTEEEDTEEAA